MVKKRRTAPLAVSIRKNQLKGFVRRSINSFGSPLFSALACQSLFIA